METNGTAWACGGNEAVYYHRNCVEGGAGCCGGCWHSCSHNKPRKLTLTSLFGLQQLTLTAEYLHTVSDTSTTPRLLRELQLDSFSPDCEICEASGPSEEASRHYRLISISLKQNTRQTACWENTNTTTDRPTRARNMNNHLLYLSGRSRTSGCTCRASTWKKEACKYWDSCQQTTSCWAGI